MGGTVRTWCFGLQTGIQTKNRAGRETGTPTRSEMAEASTRERHLPAIVPDKAR
jgi:hypothetical protein